VLVIGPGGAGKSTVAKRLGRILSLEVIHLDKFYWKPGWIEAPKEEWDVPIERLLAGESWIMDGNYSRTLERRLKSADTVVFLDFARY
jgi:adenylate kinase family enzyme